jgi:hypothetical protein
LRAATSIATSASFQRPCADPVVSDSMSVIVLSRSKYPCGSIVVAIASTTTTARSATGRRRPSTSTPTSPIAASVRNPARENVTITPAMPSSSAPPATRRGSHWRDITMSAAANGIRRLIISARSFGLAASPEPAVV